MLELLLIDVALCALLVVVAGCVMLVRRRRRRNRDPVRAAERQGTAVELAGNAMAGDETAVVPGFGDDPAESDPGTGAPAEPEQAAEPQASGTTVPAPDSHGPGAERDSPRARADGPRAKPHAPQTERDAPRAAPQANGATGPAHDPAGPGTEPDPPRAAPNGQPAAADAIVSNQIGSYYDEADRAMSDYLAAMGWTEEPETRRTG
jgi:hypothetical protein